MAVAGAPGPVAGGRRTAACALALVATLVLTAACSSGGEDAPAPLASSQGVEPSAPTAPDGTSPSDLDDSTTGPALAEGDTGPGSTGTGEEAAAAEAETPDGEHSAVRSVVEGFPVDLLPLPEDAMILVTSAAPVGRAEVQEVSLNLRTRAATDVVMELYRESLTAADFTEVPPETPHDDLAAESTFTRSGGDELVSIGVLDTDGLRTVTIGGRLRTDR